MCGADSRKRKRELMEFDSHAVGKNSSVVSVSTLFLMTDYSNPSTRIEEFQRLNSSGSYEKVNRRFTVSSSRPKEISSKEKDKKIPKETTVDSSPLSSGVPENNESSALGKKQNSMTVSASSPTLAASSNTVLNFGERREKKVCLFVFESNITLHFRV
jgi:hypothetical protein